MTIGALSNIRRPQGERDTALRFWHKLVSARYLMYLALACIFYLLKLYGKDHGLGDIASDVFRDLSIAFGIAFLSSLIIEESANIEMQEVAQGAINSGTASLDHRFTELTKEFQSNVEASGMFGAVFGTRPEPLLIKAVNEYIFRTRFLRREHTVLMIMEPIPDDQSFLRATIKIEAEMENMTADEQDYPILLSIDETALIAGGEPIKSLYINGSERSPREFRRAPSRQGPGAIEFEYPKVKVPASQRIRFSCEYQVKRKHTDQEVFFSFWPALKMRLSVHHPGLPLKVRFATLCNSPFQPERYEMGLGISVEGVILPYQGINCFWSTEGGTENVVSSPPQ